MQQALLLTRGPQKCKQQASDSPTRGGVRSVNFGGVSVTNQQSLDRKRYPVWFYHYDCTVTGAFSSSVSPMGKWCLATLVKQACNHFQVAVYFPEFRKQEGRACLSAVFPFSGRSPTMGYPFFVRPFWGTQNLAALPHRRSGPVVPFLEAARSLLPFVLSG